MTELRKVYRDHDSQCQVAVILGNPWWTKHHRIDWVFHPGLVELILSDKYQSLKDKWKDEDWEETESKMQSMVMSTLAVENILCEDAVWELEGMCNDLKVVWVEKGKRFAISHDDNGEYLVFQQELLWITV